MFKKGCIPWNKGKKIGSTPWNKGKVGVYSDDRIESMSLKTKNRILKYGHPMEGKKHSPEAIKKIRIASKLQINKKGSKGKPWSKTRREAQDERTRLGLKNTQHKRKPYKKIRGSTIVGGREYHPMWHEIRKLVYKRDQYKCQECGCHCKDSKSKDKLSKIQCHHIDYDITNNDPSNLVTLCASCHCKTNFKRVDWINHFSKTREGRK